jgi:hypothetical protein
MARRGALAQAQARVRAQAQAQAQVLIENRFFAFACFFVVWSK